MSLFERSCAKCHGAENKDREVNPSASTPDSSWSEIGPVFIDAAAGDRALRHEFAFASVAGVTGLRVIAPGAGLANGRAIDELEVYAIPEPCAAILALLSGTALIGLCRRRFS